LCSETGGFVTQVDLFEALLLKDRRAMDDSIQILEETGQK
jgi:hypothetical protein